LLPDLPEAVRELARSSELKEAAKAFAEAGDAIILYGSEGMGLAESGLLAQTCANLLVATGHVGKPNNGLLGVWPGANHQGAWEMGWRPQPDLGAALGAAKALYIAAADPAGDDPAYQAAFGGEKFVVVQELFLTQTARLADVVLPAQAWTEREGSYTSGERRAQRFYPAIQATLVPPPKTEGSGTRRAPLLTALRPALVGAQADFAIPALIAERVGVQGLGHVSAAAVFAQLAADVPAFRGLSYQKLAEVHEQWPIVGRGDLYYGGTGYENTQGLGVQLPVSSGTAGEPQLAWPQVADFRLPMLGLMAFPVTRLYDRGTALLPSSMLHQRIGEPYVVIGAEDAARLKLSQGAKVRVIYSGTGESAVVAVHIDVDLPERVVLVPRSFGIPIFGPTSVEIRTA